MCWLLHRQAVLPSLSLSLGPSYSLTHNSIKVGPINNCITPYKCSSERKSYRSLTLNQKLEMIKLSEEGILKVWKDRLKTRLLVPVSQVVNAKEKFLKEIESATWVNARMIEKKKKKQHSLIADVEKVVVVWIEDQTNHSIPLSQSLIQSKALTCFISVKVKRSEEVADLKLKASRIWFMRLKERTSVRSSSRCWQRNCSKLSRRSTQDN